MACERQRRGRARRSRRARWRSEGRCSRRSSLLQGEESRLAARRRLADRGRGLRDDEVHAELAELRRRAPRIAGHAVRTLEPARCELLASHQCRDPAPASAPCRRGRHAIRSRRRAVPVRAAAADSRSRRRDSTRAARARARHRSAQPRFNRSATLRSSRWYPPWSPRNTMSRKPCRRKLRAADSRTRTKVSDGTVIVPAKRMCAVGGSRPPSGT